MDSGIWNPTQYLKFGGERLRPGFELLARIGDLPPGPIYDLGCGTGEHARAIAARWPAHQVIAIDHSDAMLRQAASAPTPPSLAWRKADIADWASPEPAALIFSNATLHWLGDHAALFPHLMRQLAPGGTLAVQMPVNFREPSHRLIRDLALSAPFRAKLTPLAEPGGPLRDDLVAPRETYYDWLAPLARGGIDLWETDYLTVLSGERPVLEWIRGSILRPALDRLDASERETFLDTLAAQLAKAYPRRPDGTTLFPFRRLFMIARA